MFIEYDQKNLQNTTDFYLTEDKSATAVIYDNNVVSATVDRHQNEHTITTTG